MPINWEDPPNRRSPMDSGNNGSWIERVAKALADRKKAKAAKPKPPKKGRK